MNVYEVVIYSTGKKVHSSYRYDTISYCYNAHSHSPQIIVHCNQSNNIDTFYQNILLT